jgi:hypothetical protein
VIAGVGFSMVVPVTPSAILGAVAPEDMGKGSAVYSTLMRFGNAFGLAIATAVFASNGDLATPSSFTAGFRPALAVVAGLSVLGAITALAVNKPRAVAARADVAGSDSHTSTIGLAPVTRVGAAGQEAPRGR